MGKNPEIPTHIRTVYPYLRYLKEEPKMNLEVWPTEIVFDSKILVQYRTKPFIVNSLTDIAD